MRPRVWLRIALPLVLCLLAGGCFGQEKAATLKADLLRLRSAAPAPLTPAYERNLPIAQLALKKAQLLGELARGWAGAGDLNDRLVQQGEAALQRARTGQAPPLAPGKLNELAYITANDRTVQPYYLYVPPGYTPDRKWPLIVFLHGYVPTISALDPWLPSPEQCDIAGKHGCLLLVPYGRRNTDFQGVGETDVLASTAEVCKWYPVDPDRVYLSGVSMGGMGAWNLALRHPGRYAAVTPMCGQTDMFLWWGWKREDSEPWKRWLIEWDNALDQTANLRNQNFFVQHGAQDNLIPVQQTELMVKAAEEQGTPVKHYYFPDEGHYIYFRDDSYENAWSWVTQFTQERHPRRVDFKCYSLEYNRAFWLTIDAFKEWGKPATITAEVATDGGALTVTAANVATLSVDTAAARLSEQGFKLVFNGKEIACAGRAAGAPATVTVTPEAADPAAPLPAGLRKRQGLCGPCEEVLDTRFLLVQGSQGPDNQKQEVARQVARWSKDWDDFADGLPPAKLDTEVTAEDLAEANLVLFGTPQTNSVLARLADGLPVRIGDHRFEVAGKTYEGADVGLVVCYPNPLNPRRYVLVYSGELWGEKLSVNHKHDLLPDFVVFTTKSFGKDDTNDALCAGFFGMNWQLSPATTWGGR